MRRVYGIYLMRTLGKPTVRLGAFAAILLAITSSVSMPNIIHNALHSSNIVGFTLAAVSNTTMYVQLGVLLVGLLLIWTAVDALSAPSRSHARLSV